MEYTNLTAAFAKRTLQNLNYVQEGALRGEAGVYEVTQLWNSLLGLIVLPHEHVINRLPMIPMNELSPQGWPLLTTAGDEPPSVQALVRCLRNAVAHFNVEFNAGTDGEIASVTMWNEKPRPIPPSRVWEGVITIRELEHLARLLANTYILAFDSTAAEHRRARSNAVPAARVAWTSVRVGLGRAVRQFVHRPPHRQDR